MADIVALPARVRRWLGSPSAADLRVLGEALVVIAATWLLLGWFFDRAFAQSDATVFEIPYTQSALRAGFSWTDHLYRFGVIGGTPMHDYAGTLPLVQVCALLGISATTTANLIVMFTQLCFAFFAVKAALAFVKLWTGTARALSASERVIAVWLAAFAPLVGWRLAYGHENLLLGLVPALAAVTLVLAARAGQLSATTLVFAAIAVFHGVSSTGPQLIVYSIVFAGPFAIAAVLDAPRGARWTRDHWRVAAALAAGISITLPRLAGMLAYASSDDWARGGEAVTYSLGSATWSEWLGSIPWTTASFHPIGYHEHNFPIGPVAVVAIALWPRRQQRWLRAAWLFGVVLAVLFACDVSPISDLLLRAVPPLGAFRVPARACMPLFIWIVPAALAGWWARDNAPAPRVGWAAVALAAAAIAALHGHLAVAREVIAWLVAIAACVLALRARAALPALAALAALAALSVCAFDERFPRDVPWDRIEHGPADVRAAVLAEAPELASPLVRVQLVAKTPYDVALAFAAGLSSIDGDFNPPRRFITLRAALSGHDVPATAVVFRSAGTPFFPVLQQLYNVRYIADLADHEIIAQPATPGAAWFPSRIEMIASPAEFARAVHDGSAELHDRLATTAWLLAADAARLPAPPAACTGARVDAISVDDLGQSARFAVDAPADCTLVVSTTYVHALRARAGDRELAVFPVDIALTAIAVPAGTREVVLAPAAVLPTWTRIASVVGWLLLLAACLRRPSR